MRCTLGFVAIGALVACGSGDDGDDVADPCPAMVGSRCVTEQVALCFALTPSITQGVYGCVTEQSDVIDPDTDRVPPSGAVGPGFAIEAFTDSDGTVSAGTATTNEVGFFQIVAPAGAIYFRNRSLGRTEAFTIPTGTVAVDHTISVLDSWQQR